MLVATRTPRPGGSRPRHESDRKIDGVCVRKAVGDNQGTPRPEADDVADGSSESRVRRERVVSAVKEKSREPGLTASHSDPECLGHGVEVPIERKQLVAVLAIPAIEPLEGRPETVLAGRA